MHLAVNSPEYDYYAFSDQDDHWKPNKLKVAIEKLESLPEGPNLYMSNVIYWKDGEEKGLSMPTQLRTDIYHTLLFCDAFGCTQVFGKDLMDVVKANPPQITVAHDVWFYEAASALGQIYYDGGSLIQYRQHDNNQLGYDKFFYEKLARRVKEYTHLRHRHNKDIVASELLRCYGDKMNEPTRKAVSIVANYRHSYKNYFKLLFSRAFLNDGLMSNLGLKLRILSKHI